MRRHRLVTYGLLVASAFACDGAPVDPTGHTRPPAPALQLISLPPFSTTLGITNTNNPTNGVTLSNYLRNTLAKVTISGLTTVTYIPTNQQSTLDARGRFAGGVYNACYEGVSLGFTQSGVVDFGACEANPVAQDPLVKYAVLRGQGSATWTGARPHASNECGINNPPCRTYQGDKQIVIEPVEVDFTVTASPSTVNYNDTVAVTMTIAPGQVGGINVPWTIDSTKWAPAFGTQPTPCGWADFPTSAPGVATCRKPFTRSGTFTLFATVNGVAAQAAVAITVTPPTLDVTASPESVAATQSVTFTGVITPASVPWGTNVTWTWTPDTGTGGISPGPCGWDQHSCARAITKSGWKKLKVITNGYTLTDSAHVRATPPKLKVTASPQSISGPQSVTFTGTITPASVPWGTNVTWTWTPDSGTGGISPGPCGWNEQGCTRTCSKSGWKKLTVVTSGYTLRDSAHVSVVPCLTGDSLLDDSRIRRALINALNGSSPNGPAANRRERGGMRFRRPDGSVADTLFNIGPTDTPCSFDFAARSLAGVGVPIAAWHSHPFTPLDPNDPLPSNCPQVANSKPLPPGKVHVAAAGPSVPYDTQSGMDHIVVEKNGSVWRVDPNGAITPYPRNQPGQCDPLSL